MSYYKHLGSHIDHLGMNVANVLAHVRNALSAYAPLSMKLYGSEVIDVKYRLLFFTSLVLSRLLFNLHIFRFEPQGHQKIKLRLHAWTSTDQR